MKEGEAAAITRASKSNLAFAFVSMSGRRRRDITTFYAFCRVIDDIADAAGATPETKRSELGRWRQALQAGSAGEPALAESVRSLIRDYPSLTPMMFEEIISGVEMDVDTRRYQTWHDLRVYCYRVASAVGLVSIEIFGYQNEKCRDYAIALGLALQVTNIIRDVGSDLTMGRIYLPAEDFIAANYSEQKLQARIYDENFDALMAIQAARAENYFAEAKRLLPREDRRRMLPAEIMRSIYHSLFCRMQRDGFRVLTKNYRLNKWQKAGRAAGEILKFV